MKKNKFSLKNLEVKSFVTSFESSVSETIKGGESLQGGNCISYIECNSNITCVGPLCGDTMTKTQEDTCIDRGGPVPSSECFTVVNCG